MINYKLNLVYLFYKKFKYNFMIYIIKKNVVVY